MRKQKFTVIFPILKAMLITALTYAGWFAYERMVGDPPVEAFELAAYFTVFQLCVAFLACGALRTTFIAPVPPRPTFGEEVRHIGAAAAAVFPFLLAYEAGFALLLAAARFSSLPKERIKGLGPMLLMAPILIYAIVIAVRRTVRGGADRS